MSEKFSNNFILMDIRQINVMTWKRKIGAMFPILASHLPIG